ncbi:HMG1/2-like protein [Castilleja foliolosa]|uniref:HMG1/2-like protein n=1 Tax=Castilleja foliolosa TaxID=1961234 RepID=A0ABD3BJW1_9LAMI
MKGGNPKVSSWKRGGKLAVKKWTKKDRLAANDPNKPKRPASVFFVFMEDFRKQYKEKYPENKSFVIIGKAGGDKWKSLSEEEKSPYVAKAEKRKEEYEQNLKAYNQKLAAADGDDDSDKSKSEVNDEDDKDNSEEE